MPTNGIVPSEIKEQLSRILASDPFIHSGILSQFLKYIVVTALNGKGKELKEYTIARNVLSKKPDFNPQTDSIVRIHAGRLRRALQLYYDETGISDPLVISIPKGSYIPIFTSAIKQGQIQKTANLAAVTRSKITVAVLPFQHIGADSETGPFADVLGDHISNELTRYSELSVISYYSCRHIAPKLTDIRDAGPMLDAQYILTGSVQSNGRQLRIIAQLTEVENRQQLWAETYERIYTSADLFDIQNEISWKVVSQITGAYGTISRHLAANRIEKNYDLNSYVAISWYYEFVSKISGDFFLKAEKALSKVISLSPDYAMAWAVLGEVWVGGYFMGFKSEIVSNQLATAVEYGNTSIRLDHTCQPAYQTLALAYLFLRNRSAALKIIEDWSRIRPVSAGVQGAMGFSSICCGDYERGYQMIDESMRLNPYYPWWLNAGISFYHFKKEQYPDAIYWIERMNMPDVPWQLFLKAAALSASGHLEEARELSVRFYQQFPYLKGQMKTYSAAFLLDQSLIEKILEAFLRLDSI